MKRGDGFTTSLYRTFPPNDVGIILNSEEIALPFIVRGKAALFMKVFESVGGQA
jgi:hypothetical protein